MNINENACNKAIKKGSFKGYIEYILFLLLNKANVTKDFIEGVLAEYEFSYNIKDILEEFEEKGLIKITGPGFKDFSLREEGKKILGEPDLDDVKELAKKMIDLFPIGVKSGGYPVRASVNDVTDKLKKFLKTNKYTHEEILKATERYVNRKKLENYSFMQRIIYFIEKDRFSSLASEIEDMKASKEDKFVNYKFEDRL